MASSLDRLGTFHPADRQAWREWLEKNHATSPGIWIVYVKKGSGRVGLSYDDAVEEALCFGWIDSKVNPVDEAHFRQVYTPRKPGSIWSRINKRRVEKLIAGGRMTAAGLAKVEAAKADGSWSFIDDVEALELPADLRLALAANPIAQQRFEAFGSSYKKQVLYWIKSAKRPETRKKRIEQVVSLAAEGRKIRE
jgi:uncharacterized protein YdeI (YjbR/CyaY-like superfamily)